MVEKNHPPFLSIVVVALNEAAHLPRLAASIRALQRPTGCDLETLLVDGGSSDGTAAAARELGFDRVIELPKASIPVCRNGGVREAHGQWIAFIDADCEPSPDWLTTALPHLQNGQPVIIGWPVCPPTPANWVQSAWHAHWQHKNTALRHAGTEPVTKDAFRLITTRNMILARAAFDQLRGFDEDLPTGEDTDLVFRAYQAGLRVLAIPGLRVVHWGEPSTIHQFFRQQLWHANRRSYGKIARSSGGRVGANAPLFTLAFAATALLAVAGLAGSPVCPYAPTLILPLLSLLFLPAATISARAGKLALIPQLMILYAAYGAARTLDLMGFGRSKLSWKKP
ncbi:MAG TPA: glycosyltransferase [Kiritimatiellia bacterium]|nr:glycosyltransferase [Kiritimatiellia bacterium]